MLQALTFIEKPNLWCGRIVEELDIRHPTIVRHVGRDMVVPPSVAAKPVAPNGPTVVPVMRVKKGDLLHNFSLTGGDGKIGPLLHRHENNRVARYVMLAAFNRELDADRSRTNRRWTAPELKELELLKSIFCAIAGLASARAHRLYDQLFRESVRDEPTPAGWLARNERLQLLGAFFVGHYPLLAFADHGPGDAFRLTYRYDSRQQQPEERRLSRFFQQRAPYLQVGVPLMFETPSYHLRLRAPTGFYVHRQTLLVERELAGGAEVMGEEERGGSHVHLYMHGFDTAPLMEANAAITMFERPPTSVLIPAIVALLWTIFLWSATFWLQPLVVSKSGGSELAGLLIGASGLVSFWLQPGGGPTAVSPALISRLAMLVVGLGAPLMAWLLVVQRSTKPQSVDWMMRSPWVVAALGATLILVALADRVRVSWSTFTGEGNRWGTRTLWQVLLRRHYNDGDT